MQTLVAFFLVLVCAVFADVTTVPATNAVVDYAVDLWPQGQTTGGRLEASYIMYGGKSINTVEIGFRYSGDTANNCLFSFVGTGADPEATRLQAWITPAKTVAVMVGKTLVTSSTAKMTVTTGTTWHTLAIVLYNDEPSVELYMYKWNDPTNSGRILDKTAIDAPLMLTARSGFIGYCPVGAPSSTGSGTATTASWFKGAVDDMRFWDVNRDFTTQIVTNAVVAEVLEGQDSGLVIQYPMNEGLGEWSYGKFGPAMGSNSFSPLDKIAGTWIYQASPSTELCVISGDPHLNYLGKAYADPVWNQPTVAQRDSHNSYQNYMTCKDSESDESFFGIHMWHDTCKSGVNLQECRLRISGSGKTIALTIYAVSIYAYGVRYYYDRDMVTLFRYNCDTKALEIPETPYTEDGVYWYIYGTGPTLYFYVPKAGYFTISRGQWGWGYYLNLYLYTFPTCTIREGVCAAGDWGVDYGSDDWFHFCDEVRSSHSSSSSLPISSSEESSSSSGPICDWSKNDPDYTAWATARCNTYASVGGVFDQLMFDNCMTDYCFGTKIDYCSTEVDHACQMRQFVAAASGQDTGPACEPGCPNGCNFPFGECTSGACVCQPGWSGKDCCHRAQFSCPYWLDGGGVKLHPMNLNVMPEFTNEQGTVEDFTNYMNYLPQVDDSLLMYVASFLTTSGDTHHALFITADYKYVPEVPKTVTFHLASDAATSFAGSVYVLDTTYMTFDASTSTFTMTLDGSYNKGTAKLPPAAMIYDPPAGTYTFTIQNWPNPAIQQILLGSKSVDYNDLELLKVGDARAGVFSLYLGVCDDACDQHKDCVSCAADIKCGWCRDTESCMMGDATGPYADLTCYNWRYTFADVSRRVTTMFGWPTFPSREEIIIDSKNDEVPIDVTVDVISSYQATWDAIFAWPNDMSKNQDDKVAIIANANSILDTLRLYSNPYFSVVSYTPGEETTSVEVAMPMTPATLFTVSKFKDLVEAIPLTPVPLPADAAVDVCELLTTFSSPDVSLWRPDKKRMIAIAVDRHVKICDDVTLEETRLATASNNVIPVFAATAAVYEEYMQFIKLFGSGVLVELTDNSDNWASVMQKALSRAIGQVVMVMPKKNYDTALLDPSTLYMYGLYETLRAHFVVPVTGDQAQLWVPGFGSATVVEVPTDKPTATTTAKQNANEDNFYDAWNFYGTLITLQGIGYQNYPVFPMVMNDASNPNQQHLVGRLYQFIGNGLGPEITAPNTVVSDLQGRVVYQPPPNAFSIDAPLDVIYYVVNDLCISSDVTEVPIFVLGQNDPPIAIAPVAYGYEDVPIVMTLSGFDIEGDALTFAVDKIADSTGPLGKLYQYNDQLATDASYASSSIEINTFPTYVTDPQNRIIFLGPSNTNSPGIPADLKIDPYITFHAQETCCCGNCPNSNVDPADYMPGEHVLPSEPVTYSVFVQDVNDAPFVWNPPATRKVRQFVQDVICWETCHFDEDFDHPRGQPINPAIIYAGGRDIEKSMTSAILVSHTCPAGTLFFHDMTEATENTPIPGFQDGKLQPAFLFKPLPDDNKENAPYCELTYVVNDGQLTSSLTKTVTLYVAPVNDLPYMADAVENTFENTEIEFTLSADDIDSTSFTAQIMSCVGTGTLYVKLEATASDYTVVDCANLLTTSQVVIPVDAAQGQFFFKYVPEQDAAGEDIMHITIKVDDPEPLPVVTSADYTDVSINVLKVNTAPLIRAGRQDFASAVSYAQQVQKDDMVSFKFDVTDADITEKAGNLGATFDFDIVATCGKLLWNLNPQDNLIIVDHSDTLAHIRAPLDMVSDLVSSIEFQATEKGDCVITATVSDNGASGVCPITVDGSVMTLSNVPCALKATATVTVTATTPGFPVTATVASSVAGAGAVFGMAAAGVLYFIFKKLPAKFKKADDYHPWSEDGDNGTTANPFYEAADNGGENPFYNVDGAAAGAQ